MIIMLADIAAFVEYHNDELVPPSALPTPLEEKIASYILEQIPDGACIQLGIGGTANAVGYGLKDKKHLGIHSEMYTDSMAYLQSIGAAGQQPQNLYAGSGSRRLCL